MTHAPIGAVTARSSSPAHRDRMQRALDIGRNNAANRAATPQGATQTPLVAAIRARTGIIDPDATAADLLAEIDRRLTTPTASLATAQAPQMTSPEDILYELAWGTPALAAAEVHDAAAYAAAWGDDENAI